MSGSVPGLCWLLFVGSTAVAQATESPYQHFNRSMVLHHVLPRYRAFAEQASALDEQAERFCAKPSASGLKQTRQTFHPALSAWMGVQHLHFGPVAEDNRLNRIHFWPDKHNTGSRQLSRLLKSQDHGILAPAKFASASVALQGFPALERLLFTDEAKLLSGGAPATFRCALLRAVSGNLRQIASDVVAEWNTPDGFVYTIETAAAGNDFFLNEQEVLREFLGSLYRGIRAVRDLKLSRPLGKSRAQAKPRRAESWRSGRSLENVILNLEALARLFDGEGAYGLDELIHKLVPQNRVAKDVRLYFGRILETARNLSLPLPEAVRDPEQREQLERLQARLATLADVVLWRVTAAVGVRVGFNGLDGD